MPEIASALPLQPTAPQGPAVVALLASAPGATDATTPNSDFLGQLQAALKSLGDVMTAAPATAPNQVIVAAATISTSSTSNNDQPAPTKPADQASVEAELAQVVAALGLLVAPTPVKVEPTARQETASASATPASSVAMTPLLPHTSPTANPLNTAAADKTAITTPSAEPAKPAAASVDITGLTPVTPAAVTPRLEHTHVAAANAAQAANQAPVAAPQSQQPPSPGLTAPVTAAVTTQSVAPQLQNDNGSSHHSGNGGATHEDTSAPISVTSTSPDHTFAAVADSAAAAAMQQPTAQPFAVHPGEVVSQIAHQANLFQLPGNKGVRIQLHPEDLGGVQVTVRYAAGGGLELHIAVEHSATGALVQAGWSQLRDALATQGFSPDRLVMSVTAPGNANQLDFSSNNSGRGHRSDAGLASFADGGQSGQKRDGANPDGTHSATRWNSEDDLAPVAAAASRSKSVSATSRIDYRV